MDLKRESSLHIWKGNFTRKSKPDWIKRIKGDGNCFFRALSFVFTGEEDQHNVIRKKICDYIAVSEKRNVEKMRQNKVWGTTTEIMAASNLFKISLFIYSDFAMSKTWHIYKPRRLEKTDLCVYLVNSGNHFDVVLNV